MTERNIFRLMAAALVLAWAFSPTAIRAQVLRGRLVDDLSGEAIPAANITLLAGTKGGDLVARVLSDSAGAFILKGIGDGRFRIRGERIGYETVTSPPFDLVDQDTLAVELRMSVEAVPLAPLTVVSERLPLLLSRQLEVGGFLDRRDVYGSNGLGLGTFLVKSDWERRNPSRISALLQDVPGVRVFGSAVRLRTVTSFSGTQGCTPNFYLNGQILPLRGESIDDIISAFSVSAVEVYPGMSRPPQFMDLGDHPCGAIVLWTG